MRPFEALGYRFESFDLPMRIVSHTNYYPSLIQIYCKHLLEYLTDPRRTVFDPKEAPPYVITSQHLEAVQNEELRAKILDKFRLTLNLDNRYRVIALCIALASIDAQAGGTLLEGIDTASVREEALYWWPAGFARDSSIEAFRTILDEMIGLGILRKVGNRSYALRSPNLVSLLGTRKEIEEQLLDAANEEPPATYERETFRRARKEDVWIRSPITAGQETELASEGNGVVVLFGTPMSGLLEAKEFLRLGCERGSCVDMEHELQGGDFVRAVGNLVRETSEGLTLAIVPPVCPWTDDWVEGALEILNRKTSKKRFCRVVFLGDSRQAWWWARLNVSRREWLIEMGLRELSLKPWSDFALRQWMDEVGLAAGDGSARGRVAEITGLWSDPLHVLAGRCRAETHRWLDHLEQLRAELVDGDTWVKRAGLIPEGAACLRVMAEMDEPLDAGQIGALASGVDGDAVRRVLAWGELVSYVRAEGQGRWSLDPFVRRLVAASR